MSFLSKISEEGPPETDSSLQTYIISFSTPPLKKMVELRTFELVFCHRTVIATWKAEARGPKFKVSLTYKMRPHYKASQHVRNKSQTVLGFGNPFSDQNTPLYYPQEHEITEENQCENYSSMGSSFRGMRQRPKGRPCGWG